MKLHQVCKKDSGMKELMGNLSTPVFLQPTHPRNTPALKLIRGFVDEVSPKAILILTSNCVL